MPDSVYESFQNAIVDNITPESSNAFWLLVIGLIQDLPNLFQQVVNKS